MKRIIYLNLSDSNENTLGSLKDKLIELSKDKCLGWFISMELLKRRDDILFNDNLSSDFKEGAIQQITEITDMLFGSGVKEIQKFLERKNKPVEEEKAGFDEYKKKVLKN